MRATLPGIDAYDRYLQALGYEPMTGLMRQYGIRPGSDFGGMPYSEFSALQQALNYQPQAPATTATAQPYQEQGALSDALASIQARMQGQQAGGGRPAGSYGAGLDAFRGFNPIRGGGPLYQSGPPRAPSFGAAPWLRGISPFQQGQASLLSMRGGLLGQRG